MFSKLKQHLFNKARDKKLKNHSERSRTNWKVFGVILLSILIFGIGQVKIAHAESVIAYLAGLLGIGEIAASAISMVAQGVGYLFGFIGGVLMSIAGYLAIFALNINFALLKSPVVQAGWQTVLNFTNLGFILAIIVIAFATIFRFQSYAMKQTLWKLIVAALLVNFSLVIAGAFINVSDSFSNFFLKQGDITSPTGWMLAFVNMFKAQTLLKINDFEHSEGVINTTVAGANMFGGIALQNIASIFFIVMFTLLASLTLLATAIMLLIRYVYLGILLILSPIVWLLWIFPSTQHLWQKWWNKFLRWTFFAPIMLFFISLSRSAMEKQPEAVRQFTREAANAVSVRLNFGVDVIGEMVIAIGLVMGGLIAANSLGITFASTAYGWAQSISKGFGKAVGRKTYEGTVGKALGSEKVKGWTEKLSGSKFVGARLLGQGLNQLRAKSEKYLQADYEKLAKEFSPDKLMNEILSSRGTKRAVLLREAAKRKDIDLKKLAPILNNPEELEKIEKDFARAGLNIGDVWKAIGRNSKMIKAAAAGDDNALRLATDEYVKSLTPKDYAKGQWNDIFKDDSPIGQKIQKQLAGSFAMFEPGAYAKIAPHLKGETLDKFAGIMNYEVNLMERLRRDGQLEQHLMDLGYRDARNIVARIAKAAEALDKTLSRRFMYGEEQTSPPREAA